MQHTDTLNPAPQMLRQLDPSKLPIGSVLPGPIYDAAGDVLLRAGWKLRRADVGVLLRRSQQGLFGGTEWSQACVLDEPAETAQTVHQSHKPKREKRTSPRITINESRSRLKAISLDNIKPGSRLACGLFSDRGILLLGEGIEVTPHFLRRLQQHGIFEVKVDPEVHAELTKDGSSKVAEPSPKVDGTVPRTGVERPIRPIIQSATVKDLDRIAQSQRFGELTLKSRIDLRSKLPLADFREESRRAKALYNNAVEQVGNLLGDMSKGHKTCITAVRNLLTKFQGLNILDASLLPTVVSLWDSPDEYLFQHSVNVGLLSMTAAAGQGLPQDDVREIGVGAMLQDVGMLQLPQDLRNAPRVLTDEEREIVQQHPFLSVSALEKSDGVSGIAMMIAYQSHERPDRSGYPRGHHNMFIHPYARIVAAADAFVAVCSPRPYRQALSPYKGMEFLLNECKNGHFDRDVVRNLLDCMSLFPVGTYVRLSDGRDAKVLRANPGSHTRPVVLPLDADGFEGDQELDLVTVPDIEVVEAYHEHPSAAE